MFINIQWKRNWPSLEYKIHISQVRAKSIPYHTKFDVEITSLKWKIYFNY